MKLSIVTTLYHSAPYLEAFHARMTAAASKFTDDFEIVFVNDGSPDASLEGALALFEKNSRVRVIDLSRNFGHYKAIMTGLARARGDLVFLIDSDLEEPPEILEDFCEKMRETEVDVVYGVQEKRKGGWFERISGSFFYALFNFFSDHPVPKNAVTARLMSRRYVSALTEHRDREVFLAGLWAMTGFEQVPLTVRKTHKGVSTYDLSRKVAVFVNSITSFSSKPLVYVFYLGMVISFLSSVAAAWLIVRRLFFNVMLMGWPSLIVSIWLLGGLAIFSVGIVGIYLSKVFMEVKDRPYTVIRAEYGHDSAMPPEEGAP